MEENEKIYLYKHFKVGQTVLDNVNKWNLIGTVLLVTSRTISIKYKTMTVRHSFKQATTEILKQITVL